jgi:hypothetical protein
MRVMMKAATVLLSRVEYASVGADRGQARLRP